MNTNPRYFNEETVNATVSNDCVEKEEANSWKSSQNGSDDDVVATNMEYVLIQYSLKQALAKYKK